MTAHPTPAALAQLAAGTLTDPAVQRVVAQHLLRQCPICLHHLGNTAEPGSAAAAVHPASIPPLADPPADAYPELLARNLATTAGSRSRLVSDSLHAAACWNLLEGAAPTRRLALVCGDARFHQWPLAARLLDTAADIAAADPEEAEERCRLALAIADRLPADRYPAGLLADLRARAHAFLGEALRRAGYFAAAGRAINRAWQILDTGSGDPLERAALLSLEANLDLSLGDFAAAASRLRPAAAAYRLHRQPVDEGRTLYKLSLLPSASRIPAAAPPPPAAP